MPLRAELADLSKRLARISARLAACPDSAPMRAPVESIWRHSASRLVRLRPARESAARTPLLVVYSLVNAPGVLDLEPNRSLLRRLSDAGFDVYLLDWSDEGRAAPTRTLDSYIDALLRPALLAALKHAGVASMAVLGVCQGGTLALSLAALEPSRIRALVCMVTPVDFHAPGHRLGGWLRPLDVSALRASTEAVSGELVAGVFRLLNPARLGTRRYLDMLDDDEEAAFETRLRLARWLDDPPPLGPVALADFVARYYGANAFIRGSLRVGEVPVTPADVHCPLLNVYARHDAIVPKACSEALAGLPSLARYSELELAAGHVGALVGAQSLDTVSAAVARFVREES